MIKKILLSAAIPALLAVAAPTDAKADGNFNLGSVVCTKAKENGMSFLLFSYENVDCVYHGVGGPQKYTGVQGILVGIDIGGTYTDVMTYQVLGGSWSAPALSGAYTGVQATVEVGVGPTVQAGLIGVGNGVTLVPFGIGGGIGLEVSAGVSYLTLTAAK